jgi:hypothetical protein
MPAQRVQLGCFDLGLKCQRVAVVDALAAPVECVIAGLGASAPRSPNIAKERRQAILFASHGRTPPRIAHKLTFFMPLSTFLKGVLMLGEISCARNFL